MLKRKLLDESANSLKKEFNWKKILPTAITIMTVLGLHKPLMVQDAGWPGLVIYVVVVTVVMVLVNFGLVRLFSTIGRFSLGIFASPWTRPSRPQRWRVFAFRGAGPTWRERLHTIARQREEAYVAPPPCTQKENTPEYSPDADRNTILIAFLDDAYGLKVAGEVPGMLYWEHDNHAAVVEKATKMLRAASNDAHKVCAVIVPSRKADTQHVGKMFEEAVKGVAEAFKTIGPERSLKARWAIRVDSCLRTHFHEERAAIMHALYETLESGIAKFDYSVFAPCNIHERRITNYGVQFYRDSRGGDYRPMAQDIEYSSRPGFEYQESNLAFWVHEKTQGKIQPNTIHLTNVAELRTIPEKQIAESIVADKKGEILVMDGENAYDAAAVVDVAKILEKEHGKHILYQVGTTVAAMLSGRPALASKPLTVEEIKAAFPNIKKPGLMVVGSLTNRTRNQVFHFRVAWREEPNGIVEDMFNDKSLADPPARSKELEATCSRIKRFLRKNEHVVLFSGLWADNKNEFYPSTSSRNHVLTFFSAVVEACRPRKNSVSPGWIVFKGSDTAYECMYRALGVRNFDYLGPIASGALLCKITDENNPWRDTPIILFAGNSGENSGIYDIAKKMQDAAI